MRILSIIVFAMGCEHAAHPPSETNAPNKPLAATYAVSVSVVGDGHVASFPIGVDCGSNCSASVTPGDSIALWADAAAASAFVGWSVSGCSGSLCVVTPTTDTAITATFASGVMLSVNLCGAGHGSVTSDVAGIDCHETSGVCSAKLTTATTITLTATPDAGFYFGSWRGDCAGRGPVCQVEVSAARSVQAVFSAVYIWSNDAITQNPGGSNVRSYWAVGSSGQRPTPLIDFQNVQTAGYLYPAHGADDGTMFAYFSLQALDGSDAAAASGVLNLWTLDFANKTLAPITTDTSLHAANLRPVFSPDDHQIAFASDLDNAQLNWFVAPSNGTTAAVDITQYAAAYVPAATPTEYANRLSWSPDGLSIAFLSTAPLPAEIGTYTNVWIARVDGSTPPARLTNNTSAAFSADPVPLASSIAWSPKGDKIAFAAASDQTDLTNNAINLQLVDISSTPDAVSLSTVSAVADSTSVSAFVWDATGDHLIYGTNAHLREVGADASNDHSIANASAATLILTPDGNSVIFQAGLTGLEELPLSVGSTATEVVNSTLMDMAEFDNDD